MVILRIAPWIPGMLVLCLVVGLSPAAAQSVVLQAVCDEVAPAETAELPVVLRYDEGDPPVTVLGWSYSLCHEDAELEYVDVIPGVDSDALNDGDGPDVRLVLEQPGGVSVVTIVSYDDLDASLGSGQYELDVARYTALGPVGSTAAVQFCALEVCDDPPVDCTVIAPTVGTSDGVTHDPERIDGAVDVVDVFSPTFRRGDANGDGDFNPLTDALFVLNFVFIPGSPAPRCGDAADFDDDGVIDGLADALGILNFGFLGGAPAPPPGSSACGLDCTPDALDCLESPCP